MNLIHTLFGFLCAYCHITRTMSNVDIREFFPQIKGNLSQVTWAHSVNNKTHLKSVLDSDEVMMIEADIVMGKIINSISDEIPIMAHPPSNTSDLSLEEFLKNITEFNSMANITEGKGKGIKLDFKSTKAFEESLEKIKGSYNQSYPLWLNADILQGPIDSQTEPVDNEVFLTESKKINGSVLSLGWTTAVNDSTEGTGYTNEHITNMSQVINDYNVTNTITFPVRAALTAHSYPQMKKLLKEFENSTLTIWSHPDDLVDFNNLRKVILDIGVDKIYLDIPDDLKEKLRLDIPINTTGSGKTISILGLLLCVFVVTI